MAGNIQTVQMKVPGMMCTPKISRKQLAGRSGIDREVSLLRTVTTVRSASLPFPDCRRFNFL